MTRRVERELSTRRARRTIAKIEREKRRFAREITHATRNRKSIFFVVVSSIFYMIALYIVTLLIVIDIMR
jgi:hypothetical protein